MRWSVAHTRITSFVIFFLSTILLFWFYTQHASIKLKVAEPAQVKQNPYTDWFLLWQQRNHSHTLVVAAMKSDDISWLTELDLEQAVYVVDDKTSPLHTPANKGNEAMAYLSYIIDFYDTLPAVSTFIHSHAGTWHNSELFNRSTVEIVRRLSLEKVVREGYVNLRCDLDPGCPVSAQLSRSHDADSASHMNGIMADAMKKLFGEAPDILGSACCAQFSLLRESIRQHSKKRYEMLREWLMVEDLPNAVTGRVFEYVWHYLFTGEAVFCPSEHVCYCDAYAICFPSSGAWEQYNDLLDARTALRYQQDDLEENEENLEERKRLQVLMDDLQVEARRREEAAFVMGADALSRQRVLYDAWEVLKSRGGI